MLFPSGQIVATPGVLEAIPRSAMIAALRRHLQGDWGDVDAEDRQANDWSVKNAARILSSYKHGDTVFWILTESTREATTFLLPAEY